MKLKVEMESDVTVPKVDAEFLRGWGQAARCLGLGEFPSCAARESLAHRSGTYTRTLREWSRTSYGRGYASAVLAAHGGSDESV